ncbi:Phospholipase/Carboxylesterase-domain-containing protein [Aspergillus californicus]
MPSPKPYPAPLVTPPLRNDHTHTLILLHGRGSNSDRFGSIFLESTQIAQRLPTVKFIFPTAKKRRSMVLKRTPIHQWFDNYSLDDPNMRTDLQVDGLGESSRFLRTLIDDEARLFRTANDIPIPAGEEYSRIVIGGLSQGCALSVFCLLGGFPFEKEITGLLKSDGDNESDDDPFSRDDESEEIPAPIQALNHARDIEHRYS